MHAQIVVIVCTSCLCLFVLYFVIANVICAQKFWSIKHTNTVCFVFHFAVAASGIRAFARTRKKRNRDPQTDEQVNEIRKKQRGGEKSVCARAKGTGEFEQGKSKGKEKKRKDGMFYWEGARQIIARKFYF